VYNQEYSLGERDPKKRQKRLVDFLRRNAAANEKNANKQKIKERIFQRKEFFFSSFVEQRASTKKKIKQL